MSRAIVRSPRSVRRTADGDPVAAEGRYRQSVPNSAPIGRTATRIDAAEKLSSDGGRAAAPADGAW